MESRNIWNVEFGDEGSRKSQPEQKLINSQTKGKIAYRDKSDRFAVHTHIKDSKEEHHAGSIRNSDRSHK